MEFQLDEAVEMLSRTPATLNTLLKELPAGWVMNNEGPETWSPYDVIGHLIHGEETDWVPRARVILEHGESRPFDTFDRFAQFEKSKGKSLDQLLEEFAARRKESLAALAELKLTPEKLELRGVHPKLGTVTLGQLLATWVAHDMDHISQVVRVMSKQYAEAVGPWKQYLSIVNERPGSQ
jgi:hypothetical protein